MTLVADFAVTASVVGSRLGPTRAEEDFASYLAGLLATCSSEAFGRFVMDNLNIPCSEVVVPWWSMRHPQLDGRASSSCATAPTYRIILHFVPKRASWLNPIQMWFSSLARKVIRRGKVAPI